MPEGPDGKTIIIVKKVSGHGGHHGGAWKVAYADFVTAMMALFMVLWLVNSASVTTREKIASYFKRPGVFEKGSGTPLETGGAGILPDAFSPPSEGNASIAPSEHPYHVGTSAGEYVEGFGRGEGDQSGEIEFKETKEGLTLEQIAANIKQSINEELRKDGGFGDDYYGDAFGNGELLGDKKMEQGDLMRYAGQLIYEDKEAFDAIKEGAANVTLGKRADGQAEGATQPKDQSNPSENSTEGEISNQLQMLKDNPLGEIDVIIDQRGIHIEIMDTEKTSMFEVGSAAIRKEAEDALEKIAHLLVKLPNPLDIEGHTDALPFSAAMSQRYDNWNLSMDRANSARRALQKAGLEESRIARVVGYASQKPKAADPMDPSNRRITITMRFSEEAAVALGGKGKTVNTQDELKSKLLVPSPSKTEQLPAAVDGSKLGIEVGTHLPEGEVIEPEKVEPPEDSNKKDMIFGEGGSFFNILK